jgi:hypothetical protein
MIGAGVGSLQMKRAKNMPKCGFWQEAESESYHFKLSS